MLFAPLWPPGVEDFEVALFSPASVAGKDYRQPVFFHPGQEAAEGPDRIIKQTGSRKRVNIAFHQCAVDANQAPRLLEPTI